MKDGIVGWGRVLLIWCLLAGLAHGASYTVAPAAGWVDFQVAAMEASTPDNDISSGVYYLLLDRQIRKENGETSDYRHQVKRVVNQQGVDRSAALSIDFDPGYQTLVLHNVTRHRDGEVSDLLKTSDVKLLHREEEMEYRIYNGMRTLNLIFKDVRVGDTVEYSYTITGENPSFYGKLYRFLYLGWSVPVHTFRIRISVPRGEPLYHKVFNSNATPTEIVDTSMRHLELSLSPVPGYRFAGETPGWNDPYPAIQVSQDASWEDVVTWAVKHHRRIIPLSPGLRERIESIKQRAKTPEERIVHALEFVQDEIRYLGIEIGEGSYVPTDPSVIHERRFGDCKDKSLLYCTMLQEMGIKAWPVLVSTWERDKVVRRIPSPAVFNHVITAVAHGGRLYLFDPTATHERGRLDVRVQANYDRGLILRTGEVALTRISQPRKNTPDRQVFMNFDLARGVDEPARLTVRTIMTRRVANDFRYSLEKKSRSGMEEHLRDYYTSVYSGIDVEKPFEVSDDEMKNEIILAEHYIIRDFWEHEGGSIYGADLYPREVGGCLDTPRVVKRDVPFGLTHPTHLRLLATCTRPSGWDVPPEKLHKENKAMAFDYNVTTSGDKLMLYYDYRSISDHVPPEDLPGYIKDVDMIRDTIDFSIVVSTADEEEEPHFFWGRLPEGVGPFSAGVGVGAVISFVLAGIVGRGRRRCRTGEGSIEAGSLTEVS
ncbi:hypothetical protein DSLASN_33870 [Desulfoluna limicola]|uniref:DUF3857 domain-containing protein n=1 Tax=Desulfoluna limicola TaxID=2810562 RepID=A0ABM7PL04_9BACT|nr:DUF3857 domain-containing transglutaminase family protein [Desulfoluna limicola]BCS97755.1 hypothetical protein DSLASN_33870 [Desulfoluna limicola]